MRKILVAPKPPHWYLFLKIRAGDSFTILYPIQPELPFVPRCSLAFQRKHADADPLYARAIKINVKQLGPDHPDLAQWFHDRARSLATRVRATKRFTRAYGGFASYLQSLHVLENSILAVSHG